MPQSINQRINHIANRPDIDELRPLLVSILTDLAALRTLLNTHVHSGVTVGAGNTGVPTVTAAALDLLA